MHYFEKLKDPRWQKKRLEIFNRDNFRCCICKEDKLELHVHHESYSGKNPWDVDENLLKTVCCNCHKFVSDMNIRFISEIENHEVIHNSKDFYTCIFIANLTHGYVFLYQYSKGIEPKISIIPEPQLLINKLNKINGQTRKK